MFEIEQNAGRPGWQKRVTAKLHIERDDVMPTQTSSVHFFLSWAKERIDEMDATLASLRKQVCADAG